jgi:hypothetical protein
VCLFPHQSHPSSLGSGFAFAFAFALALALSLVLVLVLVLVLDLAMGLFLTAIDTVGGWRCFPQAKTSPNHSALPGVRAQKSPAQAKCYVNQQTL